MSQKTLRIIAFIVAFIGVLVLPWWLSSVLLVAFTIYFPLYLELIFFGFFMDVLYRANYSFPYTMLVLSFVITLSGIFVRDRIRT